MSRIVRLLSLFVCLLSPLSVAADELPPRAVARLGDYRFYQDSPIRCAAISHDARFVATGQGNAHDGADVRRTIILWDAATGHEVRRWDLPEGELSCCVFSPDGKQLALGCTGSVEKPHFVYVYDPQTGKLIRRLGSFKKAVLWLQYSSDGKRLHVGEDIWLRADDTAITSWDAATGERRGKWAPPAIAPRETDSDYTTWNILAGRLSPDEKIILWDIDVQTETPKGSVDFAKHRRVVRGYDAATNKQRYELDAQLGRDFLSADGKRFVLGCDPLAVREMATGMVSRALTKSVTLQGIAGLLPDGRRGVVYGKREDLLWVYDLEAGRMLHEQNAIRRGDDWQSLALSGDGKTLLVAGQNSVRLWDLDMGKEKPRPNGHCLPVQSLWFSSRGNTMVSQCAEAICEWNVERRTEVSRCVLSPLPNNQYLRGRSGDGRFQLVDDHGMLQLRESKTDKVVRTFDERSFGYVVTSALSPKSDKLALMRGMQETDLELYDLTTGKRLASFENQRQFAHVYFSPDGRLLAWPAKDQTIAVADATTGKRLPQLGIAVPDQRRRSQMLYDFLAYSGDGELLVAAPCKSPLMTDLESVPILVFQVQSGREIGNFYVHPEDKGKSDAPIGIALSPDGRLLAVVELGSKTVRVLEIASGRTRLLLSGHRDQPTTLAFSPDGKTLASGGDDNVIYLWDVTGTRTKGGREREALKSLEACWEALSGADAVRAGDGLAMLIGAPERSVPFLKEQLHPVASVDKKRLAELIADLDADTFENREAASHALAQFGEAAETALRQALQAKPSPEAKRRLSELLDKLDSRSLSPETLRVVRAVEALEHIGTPEARQLLKALADGAPDARLTRDAKASLRRLGK